MKRDKKAKTPKPDFSSLPIVEKKDKLDWQNFNLLENLLIFCTVPDRIAPPESGVSFRITNAQEKSVCLLFKIDRNPDPLITNQKLKRPDYLSLFIQDDLLLLTIIEMKGVNENSTERGIEQITTFRDILKQAIKEHCSSKLKFHLQGILLTPYNSTIPFFDINKEAKTGFIILPVQYSHRAELYSYISKINTQADLTSKNQYVNQKITESGSFLIEELLAKRALDQRKQDDYYSQNFFLSKDRQNSYIDYLLPNNKDWITLFTSSEHKKIQLAYSGNDEQASDKENAIPKIQKELEALNLTNIVEIINRSLITKRSS
jgi:hypothetical protein